MTPDGVEGAEVTTSICHWYSYSELRWDRKTGEVRLVEVKSGGEPPRPAGPEITLDLLRERIGVPCSLAARGGGRAG